MLAALSTHDIEIPYSCEQGVCGTCLTRLLGGEPEHRDHFLTEQERRLNDQFLPCCSRSKSKLLILTSDPRIAEKVEKWALSAQLRRSCQ